jgi:hypothetical protein
MLEWIILAQDTKKRRALVNSGMKLRVPYNGWNFLNSLETVSISGVTLLRWLVIQKLFYGGSISGAERKR